MVLQGCNKDTLGLYAKFDLKNSLIATLKHAEGNMV